MIFSTTRWQDYLEELRLHDGRDDDIDIDFASMRCLVATLERRAAKRPMCVLQPLGQCHAALAALGDVTMLQRHAGSLLAVLALRYTDEIGALDAFLGRS